MKVASLSMTGTSIGSFGTSLVFSELKLAFDMGRTTDKAVHARTVCITHGHMDHIGGIGHHCARRELFGLEPPVYVMGPDLVDGFNAMMAAFRQVDGSKLDYRLVVLRPGERHRLSGKGPTRNFYVEAFQSTHVVPTQGYVIVESKKKLRPDLVGTPSEEIAKLARAGEEVSVTDETYRVAYTGDTRIEVLEQEAVRKATCLIIDCTFLDGEVDPDKAYRTWHIHIDHLIERAALLENDSLILTHFSMRHSPSEVKKLLRKKLPGNKLGKAKVRILVDPFCP